MTRGDQLILKDSVIVLRRNYGIWGNGGGHTIKGTTRSCAARVSVAEFGSQSFVGGREEGVREDG